MSGRTGARWATGQPVRARSRKPEDAYGYCEKIDRERGAKMKWAVGKLQARLCQQRKVPVVTSRCQMHPHLRTQ